jgi:Yqey-like protein.
VSDDEIRSAARAAVEAGANKIGAVMGVLIPRFKGRAEGATINRIAREELEKKSA